MVIEVKTEVKIDEDGNEYLAQVIEAPADGEEARGIVGVLEREDHGTRRHCGAAKRGGTSGSADGLSVGRRFREDAPLKIDHYTHAGV